MDDGADDAVPDGDGVTYRVSAYVTTFDDTITFALVSNGNLWSAEERAILNLCRPGTLSEGARLILSRLSLRRPKWIKSNSISHYVPYHQKPGQNVEAEFHASLDSLERHSCLEYVNAKSPFETAYEAVESSFLLDDLLILYKKLTTQKNVTNGNSKPPNKEGLLEAIMQAVRTQKTLFGQPLMHKFSHTVVDVLKELPVAQNRFRSSFPQSRTAGNSGNGYGNNASFGGARISKGPLRLLRINPQILHLLRRCQRLYQISCNASNNGHSGNTSSNTNIATNYYATGAAAANNTSAATTGFASVLQPLEFNAPLLVLFRKVCYPEPYLHCSSALSSAGCAAMQRERCSRIFASMKAFRQWEGAVELHAACLDRGIEGMLLDARSTDRLNSIVATFDSPHFAALCTGQSTAAQLTASGDNTAGGLSLLRWTQLLVHCRKGAASPSTQPASTDGVNGTAESAEGGADNAAVSVNPTTAKKTIVKKRNSTEVELSALSTAHLLAVLCVLSYTCAEGSALRAEDYLIKFDAGTQLAYALSDAACQCEKELSRQYPFAVLLYELLLLLPYLPHRRGAWYKRLCVDYAHLQLSRCALRACYRCSADPLVNVSDKTDLAQRATSLRAKLQKLTAATSAAAVQGKKGARGKQLGVSELPPSSGIAEQSPLACYAVALDFPAACPGSNAAADRVKVEVEPAVEIDLDFEVMPSSRGRRKKVKQEPPPTVVKPPAQCVAAAEASAEPKPDDAVLRALYAVNAMPPHSAEVKTLLGAYLLQTVLKEVDLEAAASRAWDAEDTKPESTKACGGAGRLVSVGVTSSCGITTAALSSSGSNGAAWNLSSVTKRAQTVTSSTTTTAPSPRTHKVQPAAPVVVAQESWSCQVCTFVNDAAQTIACAVCMHAKPAQKLTTMSAVPARAATVSGASTSQSATASVAVTVRTSTTSAGGTAQVKAHIVDLLSDDDEDAPAVVEVRSTVAVKTVATQLRAAAPSSGAYAASQDAANADWLVVEALHREVEAHSSALLAAAVAQCQSQCGNDPSKPGSASVESALNLATTDAAEDEEGTDLLLLGLLASTHLREDNISGEVGVGAVRPSLEDIIPAPPFFVVSGKRIGDPGRKGKSLFCGLNGELVNVEEYVLQKCYAVDPDEVAAEEEEGVSALQSGAASALPGVGAEAAAVAGSPPLGLGATRGSAMGIDSCGAEQVKVGPAVLEAAEAMLLDLQMQGDMDVSPDELPGDCCLDGFLPEEEGYVDSGSPVSDTGSGAETAAKTAARRSPRSKRKLPATETIEEADFPDADCEALGSPPLTVPVTTSSRPAGTKAKANAKMDSARRLPYTRVIDGGGWQGWHCEGAVFQSLFGLLMWDTLFTCPCAPTGCAPISAPSPTECASCNVFVTPFQDGPLDLGYRSFFQSRRDHILARIAAISAFSTQDMIAQLGEVYRAHYGETCRGVHWGMSLPLLQVMAVCMGGPTVAAVCRAMAVNFKHFTGGAPDLMLVRVQRRVVVTPSTVCASCRGGNDADSGSVRSDVAGAAEAVVLQEYEVVHLSELLGVDWASQMRSEVKISGRDSRSTQDPRSAVAEGGASMVTTEDAALEMAVGREAQAIDVDAEETALSDFPAAATATTSRREAQSSTDAADAMPAEPSFDRNWHIRDLFLPQLAPKPPTRTGETTQVATCTCHSCSASVSAGECGQCLYEYRLEAKFVEVKGPTDSLMYRQRVWLQILNSSVVSTTAVEAAGGNGTRGGPCAVVCHVKE